VILFHEKIDAERAVEWGVASHVSETPLEDAFALVEKLGTDNTLARALAKSLIDARGGGHEDALRLERIAEGLLYEAKYKPRAVICGLGTAAPEERYTQKEVADLLQVDDPRMRAIYSAAHIESRRLAEIAKEQQHGVSQGGLLDKHLRWAKKLGAVAIPDACKQAGVELHEIGFFVTCTTTGFLSPGLSAHVANHVGLVPEIQRVDIVGMGCHAGLNCMATAAHWAEANPGKPALMFACEVVSAGYMWDHTKPDIAIALTNSLFGDGSAAAVLICPTPKMSIVSTPTLPRPMLYGFESLLLPNSVDTLCYNWLDDYHKYSFTISPQVPYLMGLKIPGMVQRLLDKNRLKREDISHWVIHSGGKKVLDSVMYSLGISKHAIRHSLNSLRAMGNMSSGSFLWAYDALLREQVAKSGDFGMFITMGPGAGVECALWRFL
jgi:predicted naringenin-chalcone synthase